MTFPFPLDNLAQDPYDVVAWSLFILLFQWCLALAPSGGTIGYNEMRIQFNCFLMANLENLQEEFFFWT